MKAALPLQPPTLTLPVAASPRVSVSLPCSILKLHTARCSPTGATAPLANDSSTVDYSSLTSVFPAEACETVGGDVCDVEMYPEAKLKPEPKSTSSTTTTESVDREYLEYDSPKTVFVEEACDDLGGEFCDPERSGAS